MCALEEQTIPCCSDPHGRIQHAIMPPIALSDISSLFPTIPAIVCRVSQLPLSSVGIALADNFYHRQKQNLDVEQEARVLGVPDVKFDTPAHEIGRFC